MKILLDTSFIRHLDAVHQISLLSPASSLDWMFVIPQTVLNELSQRDIPSEIQTLLDEDVIKLDSCSEQDFITIPSVILGLDDGELEAICIINKCENRQFLDYLLLTDDGPAQKKAGQLGINSLDIISFLLLLNQRNILAADVAIQSLSILEQTVYHIDHEVKRDFLKRLT